MSDIPQDRTEQEQSYCEELIWHIRLVHDVIVAHGVVQPLDVDNKSLDELDALHEQMTVLFRRYVRTLSGRRSLSRPATLRLMSGFDAAVRSPISNQDIVERSG